jgi:formylglycine-generating enzyme required for sulfatase activity
VNRLSNLRVRIANFLGSLPNVDTDPGRKALILAASLDSGLEHQILYGLPTDQFFVILVNTLAEYSRLDDGRDAVVAILEAGMRKVGSDRHEEGVALRSEWLSSKIVQGPSLSVEYQAHRQQYLGRLRERVAYLQMSKIAPTQHGNVAIEGIYVPLPTNLTLGIRVQDYKVADWWVGSGERGSESFVAWFSKSDHSEYQSAAVEEIVGETQSLIDGGEDRISIEERERPLILAPLWSDRVIENYQSLNSVEAAAVFNRLVVLGEPGTGKSTFARYLTLCLLSSQLDPPLKGLSLERLQHWPHGVLTPILIELRKFVSWKGFPDPDKSVTADHLWNYICAEFFGSEIDTPTRKNTLAEFLWNDVEAGRAVLIFDGLDEAPVPRAPDAHSKRQRQLIEFATSCSVRFRNSRIIFTSRPYAYNDMRVEFEKAGYRSVTLIPLNRRLMFRLAVNLFQVSGLAPVEATAKAKAFMSELKSVSSFLKDRPLFLTLMATLSVQEKVPALPKRTGILLHQSIELLLDRWTRGRIGEASPRLVQPQEAKDLYRKLELIAYNTHARNPLELYEASDIDVGQILRELLDYGPRMPEILDYLTQEVGIFAEVAPKTYRFHHRTFQEFLAAAYLARQGDYSHVREHLQQEPAVWRQPAQFLGDLLEGEALWALVKALVYYKIPQLPSDDKFHWYSIWLAANVVVERQLYDGQLDEYNQVILNELAKRLIQLIVSAKQLSPSDRVQAVRALGFIGDTRPGVAVHDGLPDINWCEVPSGRFQMGTGKGLAAKITTQPWSAGWKDFTRETPSFWIDVSPYYIARYPVTISQFRAFVDAEDGYWEECWWPPLGWNLHREADLGPSPCEMDPPNLPQYNVSWFEAVAFCNWLSSRIGRRVRLPTEVEWEWAARGPGDSIFPWGDEYDPKRFNVVETDIGWASPVGCFPWSDTIWIADGPSDMCGNVWEWCSTVCEKEGEFAFKYPYNASDGREDLNAGNEFLRIVRGGSYSNLPLLARNTFRGRDRPFYRRPRQGFRPIMEI